MTNDEMRLLIAKTQGWVTAKKEIHFMDGPIGEHAAYLQNLPNYPEDLNAMHEVKLTLTGREMWPLWYDTLARVQGAYDMRRMLRPTAREEAETFLRVKGLWREETKA